MRGRLTLEQEAAAVLSKMKDLRAINAVRSIVLEESVESLRKQLARSLQAIDDRNAQRNRALAKLEARAKELGLRAEQTVKTEHGTISFRSGYEKVTYDAKELDAVARLPDKVWLLAYRSMTRVPPSVTVKVEG